jgi:hypothetical protein
MGTKINRVGIHQINSRRHNTLFQTGLSSILFEAKLPNPALELALLES